jgi:hypothetical protein
MESPLSIAVFGALLVTTSSMIQERESHRLRLAVSVGLLCGLVLARLDDALLLIPLVVMLWATAPTRATALRRIAGIAGPPVLAIAAYLLLNVSTTGMWLPVSGARKAAFALVGNLETIALVLSPYGVLREGPFAANQLTFRALLVLTPIASAVWWLWRRARFPDRTGTLYERGAMILAGYVVLNATQVRSRLTHRANRSAASSRSCRTWSASDSNAGNGG